MSRHAIGFPKHAISRRGSLHSNVAQGVWTIREKDFKRRCWVVFLVIAMTLVSNLSPIEAQNSNRDYCLAREGRVSVVGAEDTALYESKLFVTKDDLARYVFLTNAKNDGDRSAAVYRALGKAGSLPGDYWITSTEASVALSDCIPTAVEKARVDPRSVKVRRADAPLPASTAQIVHELWVTMLEKSRIDERAVPCAPTAIISATTARGVRLKAVTVSLGEDSPCLALMRLGVSLINYSQSPASKRVEAAREIEKESTRLLKRVSQDR